MNFILATLLALSLGTATTPKKDECTFPLVTKDGVVHLTPKNLDFMDKVNLMRAKIVCQEKYKKCVSVVKITTNNENQSRHYEVTCGGKEI